MKLDFKYLCYFIILVYGININAQTPVIQWQRSYGGSSFDEAHSICNALSTGFVITGSTLSIDQDVSNHFNPGFNNNDVWLIKIDSIGHLLWNKSFGGMNDDEGITIHQTLDNGFIIAANTNSNDGDINGGLHSSSPFGGSDDLWAIKTDSLGAIEWQKCLGGSSTDNISDITQTSDSGYLVTGYTTSSDGDVMGFHGSDDVFVVKLNKNGMIQWSRAFGGSDSDDGISSIETNDNGFIVASYSWSHDGDVSGVHGNSGDVWVFKLSSAGYIQWQKCYGGSNGEAAAGILPSSDGGFFIAATTNSNDYDVSGSLGHNDYWLFKADSLGNFIWGKCFGGGYNEDLYGLSRTTDGGFLMTGVAEADNGMVYGTHGTFGYKDYWVIKTDSSGNLEWGKALGGSAEDRSYSVTESSDGGCVVVGYAYSNDGDVTVNLGQDDYWVVKLTPAGLSVPETENNLMDLTIYQNHDQLTARFFSKHNQTVQLVIYNLEGKKVYAENVQVNEGINYKQLSCAPFRSGMYFVEVVGKIFDQREKVVLMGK